MKKEIHEKVEKKKEDLIEQLINQGVYKIDGIHLFELSLTDLEELYCMVHIEQNE